MISILAVGLIGSLIVALGTLLLISEGIWLSRKTVPARENSRNSAGPAA